jgi:hypothetical protein
MMTTATGRRLGWGLTVALVGFVAACGGQDVSDIGQSVTATQMDEDISFDPDAGGPRDLGLRDPILDGAFDMHAHLDPDMAGGGQSARAMDAIDMARSVQATGMRGFVMKTHMDVSSASAAQLARKEVPGVEAFGRFALNLPKGGINPAAVMPLIDIKGGWGRIVEMPTGTPGSPSRKGGPGYGPGPRTFRICRSTCPFPRSGSCCPM